MNNLVRSLIRCGGYFVEVFKDRALGLPPLNRTLAKRLMERTKIYAALKGFREREAVNLSELEEIRVRFSDRVIEQARSKKVEINPLLVSSQRIVALDARIVLQHASGRRKSYPD